MRSSTARRARRTTSAAPTRRRTSRSSGASSSSRAPTSRSSSTSPTAPGTTVATRWGRRRCASSDGRRRCASPRASSAPWRGIARTRGGGSRSAPARTASTTRANTVAPSASQRYGLPRMATEEVDVARLRSEFTDAIAWGDARLAELIGLEAVSAGVELATLYVEVMAPALHEVGKRWAAGEMSIADEHLATSLVDGVMAIVRRAGTHAPRRSRERVLLGAVETEGHVVGLRMLADLAEGAGFDVRYLGAAVPVHTLEEIIRRHRPAVVGLSLTIGAPTGAIVRAVDVLTTCCPE